VLGWICVWFRASPLPASENESYRAPDRFGVGGGSLGAEEEREEKERDEGGLHDANVG
jgi:hypothetical protein